MKFQQSGLWGLCVNYRMTRCEGDNNLDTYYKVNNREKGESPVHLRISDHQTDLSTWKAEGKRDPRRTVNISIVQLSPEQIEAMIQHKTDNPECTQDSFEVMEYVYNYKALDDDFIDQCKINDTIEDTFKTGVYVDPFADDPEKKAVINILRYKIK